MASIHTQKNRAGNTYRVLWRQDGRQVGGHLGGHGSHLALIGHFGRNVW